MNFLRLLLIIFSTIFGANSQETHVFLLAGQSNMVGRADFDDGAVHPAGTLQWGREDNDDGMLIPASVPLQHDDAVAGRMGLDIQFAIDYKVANPDVTLVFIPSARRATGFDRPGEWRVDDSRYNDAVNRVNACMTANPSFIFKGILWHQGERDRDNVPAYYAFYDDLINSMRDDIIVADDTTPFICGGLAPNYMSFRGRFSDAELVQAYLEDTPNRIPHTAYVENIGLTDIGDDIHFDAESTRELGSRYLLQLPNAINNLPCSGTTTFTNAGWTNSVPDITMSAVINANYNTATNGSLTACNVTVNSGNTMTIAAGDYLDVKRDITVNGILEVEHTASVLQRSSGATTTNNGSINVHVTTPALDSRDFILTGSPMTNEQVSSVFAEAHDVRRHDTDLFVPNPDVATEFPLAENFADDDGDNWILHSGVLNPSEGYFARPQPDLQTDGSFDLLFNDGTLNNGLVVKDIIFKTDRNGSPNIISNPYASPISADDFIRINHAIDEVYFWEHITEPSADFPGFNSANFSMEDISLYNLMGGIKASSDNSPGGDTEPNGVIATSQGFGIKLSVSDTDPTDEVTPVNTGTAIFTNIMRQTTGNVTLRNSSEEEDKLWVSISNPEFDFKSNTLVGFIENATSNVDAGYDSTRLASVLSIFSGIPDSDVELGIQGRESFDETIRIPLGFSSQIDTSTLYQIDLNRIQGESLNDVKVYLLDRATGITTNLSETTYEFESLKGQFPNRFELFFDNRVLNVASETFKDFSIFPNPGNGMINVLSANQMINTISVYDATGRLIAVSNQLDASETIIDISNNASGLYLIKFTNDKGSQTKKYIKK